MNTKHTPRPWLMHDRWHVDQGILITDESTKVGVCRVIGESQPGQQSKRVTLANARLIATAPELLAACEAAKEFMELIGNPAPPHPWMQIRDAIAKAKGGE